MVEATDIFVKVPWIYQVTCVVTMTLFPIVVYTAYKVWCLERSVKELEGKAKVTG